MKLFRIGGIIITCRRRGHSVIKENIEVKSKLEKYVRAADMGENATGNFVNYGVKKKTDGPILARKLLLILSYTAFVAVFAAFCFGLILPVKIPPFFAFVILFTCIIVFFTWRYVQIEYEYIILDGEFRMLKIYGAKQMRELCRVRVSGMKVIAPYNGEYMAAADAIPYSRRIMAVSSPSAADIYYAIFADADGADSAVFFEVTEKTMKVLRYYNSAVVITKTLR